MNTEFINSFLAFLTKKANDLETTAGFNGERTDGGAGALRKEIEAYKAGLVGGIPTHWEWMETEFTRERDPEYKEFLRLQVKFGAKR